MVNFYKEFYRLVYYLKDNVNKNYLIIGAIALAFFVFMNISTILWWGLLVVLAYFIYISRKEGMANSDKKLEKLCNEHPELDICKLFNESRQNHKKIVDTIQSKLAIK